MENNVKPNELKKIANREVSRKEALKKIGYGAFTASTMMFLLSGTAKAGNNDFGDWSDVNGANGLISDGVNNKTDRLATSPDYGCNHSLSIYEVIVVATLKGEGETKTLDVAITANANMEGCSSSELEYYIYHGNQHGTVLVSGSDDGAFLPAFNCGHSTSGSFLGIPASGINEGEKITVKVFQSSCHGNDAYGEGTVGSDII